MSRSYEKINYSLRPAKCIERKMLCESFSRLSIFGQVEYYDYVGFGSTYFSDFALFHKSLNICNMTSIEEDIEQKERFEFNRPFQCVSIEYGNSKEVLPELDWTNRTILWLDYDGKLTKDTLLDIDTFCTNAKSGSIIIISVNAHPMGNSQIPTKELPGYRLQRLKEDVGEIKIPHETKSKDLAKWGTAKVCRQIIKNEILQSLNNRNGVLGNGAQLDFQQLYNFNYSDGAKMLTTGGILYDKGQKHLLAHCAFENLEFFRDDDIPYTIEVPSLTLKEIRYLDEQLPAKDGEELKLPSVEQEIIEQYKRIYRYFPAFTEANL